MSTIHPHPSSQPAPAFLSRHGEDRMMSAYRDAREIAISEKAQRRAKNRESLKRRRQRALAAGVEDTAHDIESREHFAAIMLNRREAVEERLERGYRRYGHARLSGHLLPDATEEQGLRSETYADRSKLMAYFPALVRKTAGLRTSWGKQALRESNSKLFSLDEPYVEGNRAFVGFLRWDTDRVWDSPQQASEAFRQLVRDGKLMCAPHLLVGLRLPDGRFVRPHAILGLPFGAAVWNDLDDERCSRSALRLYKAVYYGGCEAMLDVGADPGAPWSSQQVKNPLCPEWHVEVVQDHVYPSLGEFAEWLDLGQNRAKLVRQAAAVQSGKPLSISNAVFDALRTAAFGVLRQWHFGGDEDYREAMRTTARRGLADRVHVALEAMDSATYVPAGERENWTPEQLAVVIAKVSDRAAIDWDPTKLKGRRNAGCMMHEVSGMSVREAQSAGARYTAMRRADKTVETLRATLTTHYTAGGTRPSVRELAKLSGLGVSTVQRRKSDVDAIIAEIEGQRKKDARAPAPKPTVASTSAWQSIEIQDLASDDDDGANEIGFGYRAASPTDCSVDPREGLPAALLFHFSARELSFSILNDPTGPVSTTIGTAPRRSSCNASGTGTLG